MESQVMKIATRETEKNEVVDGTIELFLDKFIKFREKLSRCDRFFGVKSDNASNFGGGGNFSADRGYGGERRGDYGGNRGGYNQDMPGNGDRRGNYGDRGGRGFQGRGGVNGGGQGGGMAGRGGRGRGRDFASQIPQNSGRGTAPRFGGRDNNRGGFYENRGRGRGNIDQNDDESYRSKRPGGDTAEDYTKRFRGGENSHRQPQNQGKQPMEPPEGCSWW